MQFNALVFDSQSGKMSYSDGREIANLLQKKTVEAWSALGCEDMKALGSSIEMQRSADPPSCPHQSNTFCQSCSNLSLTNHNFCWNVVIEIGLENKVILMVTNDNEALVDIFGLWPWWGLWFMMSPETMWMSGICVASGKPCGSSWSLLPMAVMGKKASVAVVLMTPDL